MPIYLIPPLAAAIAVLGPAVAADFLRAVRDRRAHRAQQSESIAAWTIGEGS